jgi:hypothetical protein
MGIVLLWEMLKEYLETFPNTERDCLTRLYSLQMVSMDRAYWVHLMLYMKKKLTFPSNI